jgi:hypothetical protein
MAAIQNGGCDLWREVCKPQVLSNDLGVDVIRVSQFFKSSPPNMLSAVDEMPKLAHSESPASCILGARMKRGR